jgi:hypothetical protein
MESGWPPDPVFERRSIRKWHLGKLRRQNEEEVREISAAGCGAFCCGPGFGAER